MYCQEYLRQFAYLGEENPDPHMLELRDDPQQQFQLAVMNFQRFANLSVTGKLTFDGQI